MVKQLLDNGHSLLDLVVELVSMGAKVADQLVQSNFKRQEGKCQRSSNTRVSAFVQHVVVIRKLNAVRAIAQTVTS